MGAFASGLMSGVVGGINKKKDRDKETSKLGKFETKTTSPTTASPGSDESSSQPGEFKRGGTVRKGGRAKVHKGERVLTKRQAKRYGRKRGRK
jgi:hypothetical protein